MKENKNESKKFEIIPIPGDDFETEIEEYMRAHMGANEDFMAYKGHTIGSIAFKNNQEQLEYIRENCIVFENEDTYFVCQDDGTGDLRVQPAQKTKYEHFEELNARDDNMSGNFEIIIDDDLNCMNGWDSDYYLGFKLLWDNETVLLDNEVYFENPYFDDELVEDILFENGFYVVEVPWEYFDDPDCDNKDEIIQDYEEAFEKAYVKTIVRELGVFGIAYNFIESELKKSNSKKRFDGSYKNDWADIKEDDFIEMKLSELVNLTDEDVERIIREDYEEECSLLEDARRDYEHEIAEREKEFKEEFGF